VPPTDHDNEDERLARIEQMLEQLHREHSHLNEHDQQVRRDAILIHEEVTIARNALRRTITASRKMRLRRTSKKQ
jgi:hypothetical protein